jgi:glycosyltransferase involved in cell wall biosynthesis
MNVIIDAIIFEMQSIGGISRIFREILPRICDLEPSLQITLLTQEKLLQPLPTHRQINHKKIFSLNKILRPRQFWNRYKYNIRAEMESLLPLNSEGHIFHTSYFTYPVRWKGPSVITVYDMIHEVYEHEYFPHRHEDELRERKKQCLLNADAIIAISKTTGEDILKFYDVKSEIIRVVPLSHNPVFHPFSEEEKLNSESVSQKPYLLYIGTREKYKNFITLLKAYHQWNKNKEVDLIVVGPAWDKKEVRYLSEAGLHSSIHLIPFIDDEGLCNLYNQALAFVFPSLYEGFGLPLLEAMACGCLVVASCIPSTLEIAGDCPIYFEAQNMDSLITALTTAWIENRKSERVKSGIEISLNYSWEKTARQTLEVYRSI